MMGFHNQQNYACGNSSFGFTFEGKLAFSCYIFLKFWPNLIPSSTGDKLEDFNYTI